MIEYLFVYGTLLSSLKHPIGTILKRDAKLVGKATINGKMYRVAWYPGLIPDESDVVQGELYEVLNAERLLPKLDDYEGVRQGEYSRTKSMVNCNGQQVKAWVYYFLGEIDDLRWIPSGDFHRDIHEHFEDQ